MSAQIVAGFVIITLSLICWGGQALSWFAPDIRVRLDLMEAPDDVEPLYWADIRGETVWDALTLWTMVVAGVLLTLDHDLWPYFGLVGGGIYVYFAGRGIFTRAAMISRGFLIGSPHSVRLALLMLAVWGAMATATIVASAVELNGR